MLEHKLENACCFPQVGVDRAPKFIKDKLEFFLINKIFLPAAVEKLG